MRPTFEPLEPYQYMFLLSPPEAETLATCKAELD